jgi:hypothetical protein
MEQRAQRKKRARRDFEDEDYEEPAQPRRVSARRQAAAEAQAQARKGMLRSQPSDKRKLGQKGMQRIDSMQFGGVRTPCWSSSLQHCWLPVLHMMSPAQCNAAFFACHRRILSILST